MPVSWNLSQVENWGYTKLSEWSNKELGRLKVEVPPHLHNDWTGGKEGRLRYEWLLFSRSFQRCLHRAGLVCAGRQAQAPAEALAVTAMTMCQGCQQVMSSPQGAAGLGGLGSALPGIHCCLSSPGLRDTLPESLATTWVSWKLKGHSGKQ